MWSESSSSSSYMSWWKTIGGDFSRIFRSPPRFWRGSHPLPINVDSKSQRRLFGCYCIRYNGGNISFILYINMCPKKTHTYFWPVYYLILWFVMLQDLFEFSAVGSLTRKDLMIYSNIRPLDLGLSVSDWAECIFFRIRQQTLLTLVRSCRHPNLCLYGCQSQFQVF